MKEITDGRACVCFSACVCNPYGLVSVRTHGGAAICTPLLAQIRIEGHEDTRSAAIAGRTCCMHACSLSFHAYMHAHRCEVARDLQAACQPNPAKKRPSRSKKQVVVREGNSHETNGSDVLVCTSSDTEVELILVERETPAMAYWPEATVHAGMAEHGFRFMHGWVSVLAFVASLLEPLGQVVQNTFFRPQRL